MRFIQTSVIRSIVIIVLMSTGALAVLQPRPAHADSTSALDGLGSNTSCRAKDCLAQSITTSQSDDVIIVTLGHVWNVSLLTDTSGLTFNQRLSYTEETYHSNSMWEYYAVAAAPLSSDNITAVTCCVPIGGMQVIAIQGANLGSIFDPNPSVPATVSCGFDGTYYSGPSCGHCVADYNTSPGPCSASIQTSTIDFVIASTMIADANPCRGGNSTSPEANQPPIGFTNIMSNGNFEVDYNQTTTPETTVTFNCYGTDVAAIVLDAVALGNPSTVYSLSWQGYDWDGAGEENITLNGQFIASLPATDSPQNGGNWANFTLYSSAIVQGTNTLTFTHANWDCGISDNVQNLQVNNDTSVVYSNSTSLPLDCTQSLTYTFTV